MMMTVLAAALGALLSPSPISKHPSRPFGDPLELQRLRSTDSAFASPNSLAAAAAGVVGSDRGTAGAGLRQGWRVWHLRRPHRQHGTPGCQ
jgi:hypothetical protein